MRNPPLNALRVFEIAARMGSFTAAAEALGVTSAAVSQQVKSAEAYLGRQLFLRQGNRLTLTDAGRALYPPLETALYEISRLADGLTQGPVRGQITISCLPSLAELWLIPQLARHGLDHMIHLRIEDDPVALSRGGLDLRLTYGGHFYADHVITPLFRDRVIAVAAPGRFPGFPDLPGENFIQTDWGAPFASHPDWRSWAAANGLPAPEPGHGLRVSHTAAAIAAARWGLGVALVPARLVAAEIGAGQLVALAGESVPLAWDYVAVTLSASGGRRAIRALLDLLRT